MVWLGHVPLLWPCLTSGIGRLWVVSLSEPISCSSLLTTQCVVLASGALSPQVAPAELEDLLNSHPDVLDCAVIGIPWDGDEAPKAFIVLKPGMRNTSFRKGASTPAFAMTITVAISDFFWCCLPFWYLRLPLLWLLLLCCLQGSLLLQPSYRASLTLLPSDRHRTRR